MRELDEEKRELGDALRIAIGVNTFRLVLGCFRFCFRPAPIADEFLKQL